LFPEIPSSLESWSQAANEEGATAVACLAYWIPKIDRLLQSNETYFVIVGAGHLGGPDGLLALLRQRGYKVEQL
jgi:hypothetical protein